MYVATKEPRRRWAVHGPGPGPAVHLWAPPAPAIAGGVHRWAGGRPPAALVAACCGRVGYDCRTCVRSPVGRRVLRSTASVRVGPVTPAGAERCALSAPVCASVALPLGQDVPGDVEDVLQSLNRKIEVVPGALDPSLDRLGQELPDLGVGVLA